MDTLVQTCSNHAADTLELCHFCADTSTSFQFSGKKKVCESKVKPSEHHNKIILIWWQLSYTEEFHGTVEHLQRFELRLLCIFFSLRVYI